MSERELLSQYLHKRNFEMEVFADILGNPVPGPLTPAELAATIRRVRFPDRRFQTILGTPFTIRSLIG